MYEVILFDLDDTLLDIRACEAEALRETLANASLDLDLSDRWLDILKTYQSHSSKYWSQRSTEGFSREQVIEYSWRDTLQHYGEDKTLAAQLGRLYWEAFCRTSEFNPGAKETVLALDKLYRLGVLTNGYVDSQMGRLEASGLMPLFDCVVVSKAVGIAKPDARIFDIALSRLKVTPDVVLYVGDSIRHDYEGCKNAGIDFCHYMPEQSDIEQVPSTKYRIRKLDELIDLLG